MKKPWHTYASLQAVFKITTTESNNKKKYIKHTYMTYEIKRRSNSVIFTLTFWWDFVVEMENCIWIASHVRFKFENHHGVQLNVSWKWAFVIERSIWDRNGNNDTTTTPSPLPKPTVYEGEKNSNDNTNNNKNNKYRWPQV